MVDVFNTKLPGDETLNVDVQLVPDAHDGIIILVVPGEHDKRHHSEPSKPQ